MKLTDWALAIALCAALSFIYGFVDGTIKIEPHKEVAKK